MEICMKSLSGQGRKSPTVLFIITEQFYGGRPLCWDVPQRNAQQRTCWVMSPFTSASSGGVDGSLVKIVPRENSTYQAIYAIKSSSVQV